MDVYAHGDDNTPCDAARAAFKAAEQLYRLSWPQQQRFKGVEGRRQRSPALQTGTHTPAAFPGLLDLGPAAGPPPADVAVAVPIPALGGAVTVHRLTRHPGAYHVTGALTAQQQVEWAHVCLTEAIEPPATTNHTQQYGPVHGLWTAALHDAALGADGTHWRSREAIMPNEQQPAATALLRRLRWAALGTPYDWSSRSYVPQADIRAVAAPFTELAHRMCSALIGHQLRGDVALVNLYGTGCTLSGHVDDAEADGCETAPVVSISLGVPGVLLLQNATASGDGGTAVTPLLLRSGDVVVLSGPARRARHGVPRVFTPGDTAPSKAAAHDAATAALLAASAAAHGHGNTHGECGGVSDGAVDAVGISPPVCACSLACVPAWLHHNRINISIRDMEPGARLAAG